MPFRAFSLVEVTLALGIIAFALVGIMALFPVAMRSAKESQEETKATFIAKEIFAGFTSPQAAQGQAFLVTGENFLTQRQPVGLRQGSTNVVGYNQDGRPVGMAPSTSFAQSLPDPGWFFAVRVSVQPDDPSPGVSRVEVLITTPPAAALTNRSAYPFVSLVRNR